MNHHFTCELRDKLYKQLRNLSNEKKPASLSTPNNLPLDVDLLASLERDGEPCCTLLFIAYLCFCCEDTAGLIGDLQETITKFCRENKAP